jgi:hypothetical protein
MSMFSLVPGGVSQAVSQIKGQHSILMEKQQALNKIGVGLPGLWTGADADAFIGQLTGKFLPAVARLMLAIAGIPTAVDAGISHVVQADQKSSGIGEDLGGVFDKIF